MPGCRCCRRAGSGSADTDPAPTADDRANPDDHATRARRNHVVLRRRAVRSRALRAFASGAAIHATHDPVNAPAPRGAAGTRSEEHTSELQSPMRNSYAVFCLKKKTNRIKKCTNKI